MNKDAQDNGINQIIPLLERIATALEASKGHLGAKAPEDWRISNTWLWQPNIGRLKPIISSDAISLDLLIGIEQQRDILLKNSQQFADGFAANNALLWGARGTGKSALTKAIHHALSQEKYPHLHLIEIYREDMRALPALLDILKGNKQERFILFCDDLSFDENDSSYKSLKAVLDGGIEGRPDNVILYATSNRRHLLPRDMIENERSTAIHKSESVEEKVSLSDRFGLWLGFYNYDQAQYLEMVNGYAKFYGLTVDEKQALEWAITRGNRSGRVAWQFIQQIAGEQGKAL